MKEANDSGVVLEVRLNQVLTGLTSKEQTIAVPNVRLQKP